MYTITANLMNKNFGGKQGKLRDTIIKDSGPYHHIQQLGDTQSMIFTDVDAGPFYVNEAHTKNMINSLESIRHQKRQRSS